MDSDDVGKSYPEKILIITGKDVPTLSESVHDAANAIKAESIPSCSPGNDVNRLRSVPGDKLIISTGEVPIAKKETSGMGVHSGQTIRVLASSGNSGAKFIIAPNSVCSMVSNSENTKRIPVKLVAADNVNNKMKMSVGSIKLSSGTVMKSAQPTLMCLASPPSTTSVVNRANKVALVPAQNLTLVADTSPKKVAVISVPVRQPLNKSVVGLSSGIGSTVSAAVSAASRNQVVDLISSPIKMETLSQPKIILQQIGLNSNPIHISQKPAQLSSGLVSTLLQPVSTGLVTTSIPATGQMTTGQVKFVKLLTVPPGDVIQKHNSNLSVFKPAASPVHLFIPPDKTVSTPLQVVSTAPATCLPSSQVKVEPSHRRILPSPWSKSSQDHKVMIDELNSAMAHMTKQAALTMKDIHRKTTESGQAKVTNTHQSSSRSRRSSDVGVCATEQPSCSSSKSYSASNSSGAELLCAEKTRRPCNCSRSQCLKLYCECFANGEFCSDCNCLNCANNLEHEDDRQRAIRACLDRNPFAFHPKIGKSREGDASRQHSKGCHCKRSSCLKNYCECYEAKILCTDLCKCFGCKNYEANVDSKSLMHLADAADKRAQQQLAAANRLNSEIDYPIQRSNADLNGKKQAHSFVTMDVVEATNSCLLATAEECMAMLYSDQVTEKQILEEFGRCLEQVIEAANRSSIL